MHIYIKCLRKDQFPKFSFSLPAVWVSLLLGYLFIFPRRLIELERWRAGDQWAERSDRDRKQNLNWTKLLSELTNFGSGKKQKINNQALDCWDIL